ncbi:hypothetical protein DM860_006387 [Cuscuta australis]|uniref:CHHC U11-48K-type domain-containing protein n=1 Tax=Cuscuta australis TaxID=267555 RepID=A0A328D3D5_9ASTE|nr:hypothetical protein DM860_006387 [Cuscuta australis]
MNPSAPPFQPPPAGGFPLLPPALPSSTGFLPPPGTTNSAPRPLFPPPTTTTTAEASDIPTALSALTSLLLLSQNSLDSLSGILPTASPSPTALIPCPFNPSHRLPPPPLFNHSLHCIPSSSSAELDSLIQSCSYPHNLHSSAEGNDTLFNQSLNDPEVELCFSVESYSGFDRNGFLYSDCPEVVSFPLKDPSPPMLTLPSFLLSQCSNFIRNSNVDPKEFPVDCTELLPSEIYSIRVEVESWNDYPCSYSYRVLRAMLRLETSRICSLLTWVIANSPKFGIVIDSAMSSHIVLLFKLCLKAMTSEAIGLANAHLKLEGNKESVSSEYRFDCPILARVLMWLASQLSILYGETSGRLFAINILRQCILDDALKDSLFTGLQQATQLPKIKDADTVSEEPLIGSKPSGSRKENKGNGVESGTLSKSIVSVSQVAAAVAALHERSMLEGKIRALQNVRQLSAPQRNAEHEYLKKSADEERQKRPSYKALMDHDGLPWQRSHNQETNKMKTREELLAEERDYKRRRMSYRGKKLKRSITQVMRDVIEEYMEIIKQTGGVENLTKGEETYNDAKSNKSQLESSLTKEHTHQYTKDSHSLREAQSSDFRDGSSKEKTQDRCNYSHITVDADRSAGRNGRSRLDCSRSPDRSTTYKSKHTSLRRQGDREAYEEDFYHSSSRKYQKSYDRSIHKERVDHRRRRKTEAYNDHTSVSTLRNEFDDRYDPSESRDSL